MSSSTAIIDYGMCNLDSVARAIEECGGQPSSPRRRATFERRTTWSSRASVSYADAMRNIRERSLDRILAEHVFERGVPFLGICLGMQLLARLGWRGEDRRARRDPRRGAPSSSRTAATSRIPHVGWNEVELDGESPLFDGISSGRDFYFVHSYHFRCDDARACWHERRTAGGFVSAVARGTIFGVQFHPEKSQRAGFQLLRNFLKM